MSEITTTITELSDPPSRTDPSTFDDRADQFLSELPGLATEVNAVAEEMNTVAEEVNANAVTASTAATAATAIVSASAWDETTTWAIGDAVYGSDGHTYRANTSNTGIDPTTDDGTNWTILTAGMSNSWATTYLYNLGGGGTEASPETITNNQRIELDSPFAGYEIACEAQIRVDGKWGNPGWIYHDNGGYGVKACPYDGGVVVQSGSYRVALKSVSSGSPLGLTTSLASAPCRVKVWKIGAAV